MPILAGAYARTTLSLTLWERVISVREIIMIVIAAALIGCLILQTAENILLCFEEEDDEQDKL